MMEQMDNSASNKNKINFSLSIKPMLAFKKIAILIVISVKEIIYIVYNHYLHDCLKKAKLSRDHSKLISFQSKFHIVFNNRLLY